MMMNSRSTSTGLKILQRLLLLATSSENSRRLTRATTVSVILRRYGGVGATSISPMLILPWIRMGRFRQALVTRSYLSLSLTGEHQFNWGVAIAFIRKLLPTLCSSILTTLILTSPFASKILVLTYLSINLKNLYSALKL